MGDFMTGETPRHRRGRRHAGGCCYRIVSEVTECREKVHCRWIPVGCGDSSSKIGHLNEVCPVHTTDAAANCLWRQLKTLCTPRSPPAKMGFTHVALAFFRWRGS